MTATSGNPVRPTERKDVWTRRDFLNASGAGMAAFSAGGVGAGSGVANPFVFIGGLIVGEVVLGVMRAYDIDIAGSVEQLVRAWRTNNYPSTFLARGRSPGARAVSRIGQAQTGAIQVDSEGVSARRPVEDEGFWVPGELFWAATDPDGSTRSRDLSACRCGYPVGVYTKVQVRNRSYFTATQEFEGGIAKAVINFEALPKGSSAITVSGDERRTIIEIEWKGR